ncbi:hypothetical protein DRQ36_04875 [bacterium]|nr:MAG: hypothetical protein DRQ36_04875 [bacterium]
MGENHQKEAKNHWKEAPNHSKERKNHLKEAENHWKDLTKHWKEGDNHRKEAINHPKERLKHWKERNNHPKELIVSLEGSYIYQRLTPNFAKYYLRTYIVNNNIYTATKSPLSKGDLGGLAATSAARNNCPP